MGSWGGRGEGWAYSHLALGAGGLDGDLVNTKVPLKEGLAEGEIGDPLQGHSLLLSLALDELRVETEGRDAAVRVVLILETVITVGTKK